MLNENRLQQIQGRTQEGQPEDIHWLLSALIEVRNQRTTQAAQIAELTAERDQLREGLREALERWSHDNPYAYHDEPFPTDRDHSKNANRFRALLALANGQGK